MCPKCVTWVHWKCADIDHVSTNFSHKHSNRSLRYSLGFGFLWAASRSFAGPRITQRCQSDRCTVFSIQIHTRTICGLQQWRWTWRWWWRSRCRPRLLTVQRYTVCWAEEKVPKLVCFFLVACFYFFTFRQFQNRQRKTRVQFTHNAIAKSTMEKILLSSKQLIGSKAHTQTAATIPAMLCGNRCFFFSCSLSLLVFRSSGRPRIELSIWESCDNSSCLAFIGIRI